MSKLAHIKIDGMALRDPPVRRGVLFLINIGVPILVGVATGNLRPTLTAAIAGMILSFADNDGTLPQRLRLLLVDTAAIAAAGLAGYLSGPTPPLYWALLIALTFALGFAAAGGRELVLIGRHSGIAFVVAAAIPAFSVTALLYLGGAVLLTAATRSIDYALFGPLPLLPAIAMQKPASRGGWIRFALAFAATAAAGLWIGDRLGERHGYWIVITTLVVMQPDARSSFLRIVERVAGTLAGVAAAWAFTAAVHSEIVNCIAILIVAPLVPHHVTQRYWLHTGLIALLVLLAYDLAEFNSQGLGQLPAERIEDIVFGCALALTGTAIAFPRALFSHIASGEIISRRK